MSTEIAADRAATHSTRERDWAHAALALGGFAIGTTEFATMSFLPAFTAELGVDAPAGGHVVSAYALGVIVGAPLLAVLGARMARRQLLMLLLTWFALGNLLSAVAPSFASLVGLRFLTAIPHGAYFGIATLVAANMAAPGQQGRAISRVLMGLALATVVGVPLANLLAYRFGWRVGFAVVGLFSLLVVALIRRFVPAQAPDTGTSALRELSALRRPQVWLSLGIAAVGFGGLFAVYTYLASTLRDVTGTPDSAVPAILAVFGLGIACGNAAAPRLARWGVTPAIGGLLVWSALALAIYPFCVTNPWAIGFSVFAIGCGGGLGTLLQMRLMRVAGDAQNLAASLNHAAFNTANALGPWLAGLALAAHWGWSSTGWVGCALAVGGIVVWIVAALTERPPQTAEATPKLAN
ncbi:MAG: MFS transporter [Burkholderiales bacterium]|nr:MFS transporter [Burkholderiales bacterium]